MNKLFTVLLMFLCIWSNAVLIGMHHLAKQSAYGPGRQPQPPDDIVTHDEAQTQALSSAAYQYPRMLERYHDAFMGIVNHAINKAEVSEEEYDTDHEDDAWVDAGDGLKRARRFNLQHMFRELNRLVGRFEERNPEHSQAIAQEHSQAVIRTPCNHFFHRSCLKNALAALHACPLCRTPLTYQENKDRYIGADDRPHENCVICCDPLHTHKRKTGHGREEKTKQKRY